MGLSTFPGPAPSFPASHPRRIAPQRRASPRIMTNFKQMSRQRKKILEEIHPLNIIKEVQKWPVLYDRDNLERSNHNFRQKVWCEVAKSLFPDWPQMSNTQKDMKVTELAKKWRNLRDTFRRDMEAQKKAQGVEGPARRRYAYFKHMLFLLPHVSVVQEKKKPTKAIDEDKHFLMSLIPSFRKMTDNEKLTARVEILKVIQQVRSSNRRIEFTSVDMCSEEYAGMVEGAEGAGSSADVKMELVSEGDEFDSSDQSRDSGDET
ncbi:unnamed protein product [Leptosia nina]|uniref:MADF domain-containing protein n=1 Tax=Leptosia nina TaxID=320188 RepID=A0AAV1JBT4_9NEOP